jgi:hypothetical protein
MPRSTAASGFRSSLAEQAVMKKAPSSIEEGAFFMNRFCLRLINQYFEKARLYFSLVSKHLALLGQKYDAFWFFSFFYSFH